MASPTAAQQKGVAYAPMPFAAISFLSSSFVIYHLLAREPQKLNRMYHRLVLAMNVALLPLSLAHALCNLPVPEGTPGHPGAMGTVDTCTAQGFINLMFIFTVATYYASLVLQAFLGMQNNFKEEKYRWIEIPIHLVAYCVPCAYATVIAVTENFNPSIVGCFYAKAPRGCESDPVVECERGEDISYFVYILGLSQIFLYFIFPTLVALTMNCWMKKARTEASNRYSVGMSILREEARRKMTRSVHLQVSLYLFSFWFTWLFGLIETTYRTFTGDIVYDLLIFGNCIFSLQGFVFMVVYFAIQKMGRRSKESYMINTALSRSRRHLGLTVSDIRSNAKRKTESVAEVIDAVESFDFNIFDGAPDPDSPWARFFDQGDESDEEDASGEGERPPPDEGIEDERVQNGSTTLVDQSDNTKWEF